MHLIFFRIDSFPFFPDFRAEANRSLLTVTNHRSSHQVRIVKDLVLLGSGIFHVFHIHDLLRLTVPVNELIDTTNAAKNTVKLSAGHTESLQINKLIWNPALLKPPLRLFRIKAFAFSKNLNIQ